MISFADHESHGRPYLLFSRIADRNYDLPVRITDQQFLQRLDDDRPHYFEIARFDPVMPKTQIFIEQQIVFPLTAIVFLAELAAAAA